MMLHLSENLTAIIGSLFFAIGVFNLIQGARRMLSRGIQGRYWYKQPGIITGIEYILLSGVLLLNLGMTNDIFPHSLATLISVFYTVILILAAALLGLILYLSVIKPRLARQHQNTLPRPTGPSAKPEEEYKEKTLTPAQIQRRRERRKNAALTRRRQAGRA